MKATTKILLQNYHVFPQVCNQLAVNFIDHFYTGLVYSYLAEGTGNVSGSGAFRALQRGFNHWSCGRISHIEVNVEHPQFCHVRCHMTPSIKPGVYHVSILLRRDNELAVVERAICQCAAG